jgi:glycosyltransferase involved in cell wall biosynthesis
MFKSRKALLIYQNSFPHELFMSFLARFVLKAFFRIIQYGINGCLAVSPLGVERLQKMFPKVSHFNYIPLCVSGMSLSQHKTKNLVTSDKPLKFCYIGTLDKKRDFGVVLKGFAEAMRNGLNCELHVFGGKHKDIAEFSNLVEFLKISDSVKLYGELPREQLLESLTMFDIGISVFPNILAYREASPTKLIEYMSVGLPVLASEGCVLQENVVEQSGAGILINFSEKNVAEGLLKFDTERASIPGMSRKAYDFVVENYTYNFYVNTFAEMYNER